MMEPSTMEMDLRTHIAVCEQVLELMIHDQVSAVRNMRPVSSHERRPLLSRLADSSECIKQVAAEWAALSPAAREKRPLVAALVRDARNLVMKINAIERGRSQAHARTEQAPRNLEPSYAAQPHFVADLYRRHIET